MSNAYFQRFKISSFVTEQTLFSVSCMLPLYETLIQKCKSITTLKKARQLHAQIVTTTTSFNSQLTYLNNNLISIYLRCGSIYDARHLFDKMTQRNTISFNALISAYSRIPKGAFSGLELFTQMDDEGLRPDGSTFTGILQACTVLQDVFMGEMFHAQVMKFGFVNDIRVQTCLLVMYSNCGDMEAANRVFSCVAEKDVVAWNSLIYGNMKNGNIKEGFCLFGLLLRSNVRPSQFTYSMILNACSRLDYYGCGRGIHARLVVLNMLADLPLLNSLIDMYSSCGDMVTAFGVFSRTETLDIVSWNSIISGYSENGDKEMAISLFVKLTKLSFPRPDEYTLAAVLSATDEYPSSDYGKPLHALVTKVGFQNSVFIATALVSMYFKNSDTQSAQEVFILVSCKDVVFYTEMIVGYSRLAEGESAVKLFYDMCQKGHKVDSFALSGVINTCADLAMFRQGEMIHSYGVKTGLDVEMAVCGSLVNMYAKNGDLTSAQSIFSRISNPDLMCWNSMLVGFTYHGNAIEALKIFDEIVNRGLKPDEVTYLCLLSACGYRGLVEKGKLLWDYMKDNNLSPGPRHYSCMVSLLSRAGLVDDAEKIITESPFSENNVELWRNLLSSCVVNRNLRVGVHAAEQVLKKDSKDAATHVLLSNLYAVTGKWDCVAETRTKIKRLVLEKDPGLSWIEVKNNTHVFSSSDHSHPEFDEAEAELHRLQCNMIKPITNEVVR